MRDESFKDFVLDQLSSLESVFARKMFSGHGLYLRKKFFGIISDDRLYFKTDEKTKETYRAAGMEPFRPRDVQTLKNYYEVPPEVLEDADQLSQFAEEAASI